MALPDTNIKSSRGLFRATLASALQPEGKFNAAYDISLHPNMTINIPMLGAVNCQLQSNSALQCIENSYSTAFVCSKVAVLFNRSCLVNPLNPAVSDTLPFAAAICRLFRRSLLHPLSKLDWQKRELRVI